MNLEDKIVVGDIVSLDWEEIITNGKLYSMKFLVETDDSNSANFSFPSLNKNGEIQKINYFRYSKELFEKEKEDMKISGEFLVYRTELHTPYAGSPVPRFFCARFFKKNNTAVIKNAHYYRFEKDSPYWSAIKIIGKVNLEKLKIINKDDNFEID